MHFSLRSLVSSSFLLFLVAQISSASLSHAKDTSCTVTASGHGKDDAPTLVDTVKNPRCGTIVVPKHTTLNVTTKMNMTGLKDKHISIQGTVKFNPDIDYWVENGFPITFQTQITYWLLGGKNIQLDGGGTIDGSGQAWYDAFAKNGSLLRPITLTVFEGTNVNIQDITMLNSPEWFNLVHSSSEVIYSNVNLSAVSTSSSFIANTDGWDIYRSDQVVLRDSIINNGDDCVSFKPNATNILVSNLHCNGSHGISVGSLGQFPGVFDIVENVTSTNVHISNAQNGARIKCWAGPNVGSGIVKNIIFESFVETNVDNPVIIDQCYETSATECSKFPSNTLIQDVLFRDISGTSSGKEGSVVASLGCSPDGRCSDIVVDGLNISAPATKQPSVYECQNLNVTGTSADLFESCTTT